MSNERVIEEANSFEGFRRVFSEEFKKKKVWEIERKLCTIADISREYEVSRSAVYIWISKFSAMAKKKERVIVESLSDTHKIQQLQARIAELERMVGQKQIMVEFRDKMIEIAEQTYQVDIKKKFGPPPSTGSGNTEVKKPGA
jgi:transposase-like protein